MTRRVDSSAVILNRKAEILLQLRSDVPIWGLPGGGTIGSETPVQTLARETLEETGLKVKPKHLVGVYLANYLFVKEETHVFLCKIKSGRLRKDHESLDLRFFSPRQLPKPMLYFHREMILDAVSGKKNLRKVQRLNIIGICRDIGFSPVLFWKLLVLAVRLLFPAKNI